MLHAISWHQYLTLIGVLLLLYWLFIGVVYYSKDVKDLLDGKSWPGKLKGRAQAPGTVAALADHSRQPGLLKAGELQRTRASAEEMNGLDLFPIAYSLALEVKDSLKDAGRSSLIREELMQALQDLLRKDSFPVLKDTGFKEEINKLIAAEAGNHCSIHFSADELNGLWV